MKAKKSPWARATPAQKRAWKIRIAEGKAKAKAAREATYDEPVAAEPAKYTGVTPTSDGAGESQKRRTTDVQDMSYNHVQDMSYNLGSAVQLLCEHADQSFESGPSTTHRLRKAMAFLEAEIERIS